VSATGQGWLNYGPRAASRPPINLIQSAKRLAYVFKHHVSDCGQQGNAIFGCCLSFVDFAYCIQPSRIWPSGQNVWPPMDYGINLAAWRRNFLAIA